MKFASTFHLREFVIRFVLSLTMVAFFIAACQSKSDVQATRIALRYGTGKLVLAHSPLPFSEGLSIEIERSDTVYDRKVLRYPIYRVDTMDVNQDGRTDVIVGVVKKTHFDSVLRKRIFILQVDRLHIRPLWLGSMKGQEVVDFQVDRNGEIRILDITKAGYRIGRYRWGSFGLHCIEYPLLNEPDREKALDALHP